MLHKQKRSCILISLSVLLRFLFMAPHSAYERISATNQIVLKPGSVNPGGELPTYVQRLIFSRLEDGSRYKRKAADERRKQWHQYLFLGLRDVDVISWRPETIFSEALTFVTVFTVSFYLVGQKKMYMWNYE